MEAEPTRNLHDRVRDLWYGENASAGPVLEAILGVASGGYGLAVRLRNALYDRGILRVRRLPVPVISVAMRASAPSTITPPAALTTRGLRTYAHARCIPAGRRSRRGPGAQWLLPVPRSPRANRGYG